MFFPVTRTKEKKIFYSDGIREGLSKSYELRWRQKKCGKKEDFKEKETVTRKDATNGKDSIFVKT